VTAARVAYYVLVVQLSLLLFAAAVVAWFVGTGALGTLRRDKP
jgi:hypothetical protein